jgi:hypothetical protein
MNDDTKRLIISAFLEGVDARSMHDDLNVILDEQKEFTPITAWERSRARAALIKMAEGLTP